MLISLGSSRDRHLRRCRRKQLTGTIPRKKSCAPCTQAKTRCDLHTPECSRCKTKGLDCRYYSPPTHGAPAPAPATTAATSPVWSPHEEVSLPTPAPTDTENSEDTGDASFDTSLSNVSAVDWGEISNSLLDWAPMFGLSPVDHRAIGLEASPRTPYGGATLTPSTDDRTSLGITDQFHPVGQLSRLVSVESFTIMRYRLIHEPVTAKPSSHFDKFNFMNRVIRAYPKMIASGSILPPFVHPYSLAQGKISEALANCKGLVEMYKTMTPDNRHFVMKTIVQEHDRILQQVPTQINPVSGWESLIVPQLPLIFNLSISILRAATQRCFRCYKLHSYMG